MEREVSVACSKASEDSKRGGIEEEGIVNVEC